MVVASNLVQSHTPERYYSTFCAHICHFLNATARPMPRVVAELGPGKSIGAGLTALLLGADTLYCLDKVEHTDFEENIDTLHAIAGYLRMRRMPMNVDHFPSYRFTFERNCFSPRFFSDDLLLATLDPRRVREIENALLGRSSAIIRIEKIVPWQSRASEYLARKIDFIFSHSVMEHVEDLEDAYCRMFRLLKSGGGMSHSVDLKSHNFAKEFNGHLAISLEAWVDKCRNQPYAINRRLMSDHLVLLGQAGFVTVMHTRRTTGGGIARNQLAKEFSDISDVDMSCGNLFFQVVKPE